jgi:RimJ/RimL family protein N-acetyltransferase
MTLSYPTAPDMPDDVLAKRAWLPLKPAAVTLTGKYVRLEPLSLERDVEALFAASNGSPARLGENSIEAYDADERIWRYMSGGPFASADELAAWLRSQVNAANGLPMCVVDIPTDRQIGVANFMANMPDHLKIELGSIWYSPLVQRTHANLETTYLMLKHAFGLGYRRVEWKCDTLNERSRRSALRMGFQFEGIQEYHYIIKGRSRDTAWYRVLDREWDSVRERLEVMLYA